MLKFYHKFNYFSNQDLSSLCTKNKEVVFYFPTFFEVEKVNKVNDKALVISENIRVPFTDEKTRRRLYSLAQSIHEGM